MNYLKPFDATERSMEDLMRSFFGKSLWPSEFDQIAMRMDVAENEKSYTVRAELPGVNKEDIHISLHDNQVTISAEARKDEEKNKMAKYCIANVMKVPSIVRFPWGKR